MCLASQSTPELRVGAPLRVASRNWGNCYLTGWLAFSMAPYSDMLVCSCVLTVGVFAGAFAARRIRLRRIRRWSMIRVVFIVGDSTEALLSVFAWLWRDLLFDDITPARGLLASCGVYDGPGLASGASRASSWPVPAGALPAYCGVFTYRLVDLFVTTGGFYLSACGPVIVCEESSFLQEVCAAFGKQSKPDLRAAVLLDPGVFFVVSDSV